MLFNKGQHFIENISTCVSIRPYTIVIFIKYVNVRNRISRMLRELPVAPTQSGQRELCWRRHRHDSHVTRAAPSVLSGGRAVHALVAWRLLDLRVAVICLWLPSLCNFRDAYGSRDFFSLCPFLPCRMHFLILFGIRLIVLKLFFQGKFRCWVPSC